MNALEDDDPMPFGKHKGVRMKFVPAEYIDWLRDQDWIVDWPLVHAYILNNEDYIDDELKKLGK